MKREIGRALEGELRHLRVDESLKRRILAEARRKRARKQRRIALAYAAAALAVAVVGMALVWNRPRPDLRQPAVAADPTDAPAEMPLDEGEDANLFLYATAYEGDVLELESFYLYDLTYFEADEAYLRGVGLDLKNPDECWQIEAAEDAEAAARTLDGTMDVTGLEEWTQTHENGEPMGLWYDRVTAWPENVSTQLLQVSDEAGDIIHASEYRFHEAGYSGSRTTLYLLKKAWAGETCAVDVLAGRVNWVWDGSRVLSRFDYARDAVRPILEGGFTMEIDEKLTDEAPPTAVSLPVEDGGAAAVYVGGVGWGDADSDWAEYGEGEGDFEMSVVMVELDGGETAIVLEPTGGHSLTARVHAVKAPRMVLDAAAHPGMAGWLFDEAPDGGDVVDIVTDRGEVVRFTVKELMEMAGALEPEAVPEETEEASEAVLEVNIAP